MMLSSSLMAAKFLESNFFMAERKDIAMLAGSLVGHARNASVNVGGRPMTLRLRKSSLSSSSARKVSMS